MLGKPKVLKKAWLGKKEGEVLNSSEKQAGLGSCMSVTLLALYQEQEFEADEVHHLINAVGIPLISLA